MSHAAMSHVAHRNESCHSGLGQNVTSHVEMSQINHESRHHRNESCHTGMSHVTHKHESHERMSHVSQLIPKAPMVRMQHNRKKYYLICIPFILLFRISIIIRTKETRHTKVYRT